MKSCISSTLVALGLAALASTAPTFNSAVSPDCTYPIGTRGGENARVSGRLFEIDGRVQYFAGK
jgi:mannan endo-1,4-beta-mannosidase